MLREVMVQGGALGFGVGAVVTGGTFTITTAPKTTFKVDSKGGYFGPLAWTFAGGSAPGCNAGSVTGAGTINPGAVNLKDSGLAAVLKDDSVVANFAGVSGGNPVPVNGQPVKVANAGQTSVKAE